MMRPMLLALVGAFASTFASHAAAASFDCNKASTRAEKLICSTPELSMRDDIIARLFKAAAAVNTNGVIRREQRSWIADEQARCTTAGCLEEAYDRRFQVLATQVNDQVAQRYVRGADTGELRVVVMGDWVYFTVNATWQGQASGAVNMGEATGFARLDAGQASYAVTDDCRLRLKQVSQNLWRISEEGCAPTWGHNVTLAGAYLRRPDPRTFLLD